MCRVVEEHGGANVYRDGASFKAVWGPGRRREDDPERAIRATLALREMVQRFAQDSGAGSGPDVRYGIDTGPGSASHDRAPHGSVSDVMWNSVARIAGEAPAGGILLSHSAYRHVRGVFDVRPLLPLAIPGRETLPVYLVERAKPKAFRIPTRGVEGIETRTVGRERELTLLQEAFREATGGSNTRVVLVSGEAGVGKSRLLDEFEAWLELLPERIFFFKGRATPDTIRSPNGLFRNVFSFRFDIRESDSAEALRDKFRSGLAGILEPERADVVGQWLGFDFSGSESVAGLLGSRSFRQQAMADLVRVFRTLAEKPVTLFLEDLHWADDNSLLLLDHLATELPKCKLFIVGVGRPSLTERTRGMGEGGEAFVRVPLGALTPGDSRALVDEILRKSEEIPADLGDLIVRGAGGNPFYVEELIGLLVDKGVVVVGADRWRVNRTKLSRLKVPPTLEGVLQARLKSLPPAERRMLQCASVVGRQFWDAAVADCSATADGKEKVAQAEVSGLLETARERNLIFQENSSSFEASGQYHFKHDIMRDFVYGTVLGTVRRAYHAQVARWLEGNLKGRQTEYLTTIANHFEAAGEKEKASDYLVRAGQELLKASLFRESADAFEHSLRLLPAGRAVVRASVLTSLGDARRQLGEYAAAREHLEKALSLARAGRETRTEILALNLLGRTAMVQGAYNEAKPHLAEALALATRVGDREGQAQVLLNLADASFRLGDAEGAFASGRESLQIFTGLKDSQGIAGAHRVLGFATMMRGDNEAAAHHHQQGLEIFQEVGDRWGVSTCLINLGEVHRKMGKLHEAVGFWKKSLPMSRDIGARLSVAIAHVNTGGVLSAMEKQESGARESLREALLESLAIGAVPIALEGMVSVALLHIREGDPLGAAKLLGTVIAHPSYNAEIQDYSDPLLKRVETKTGPEALRAALDWGRAREFQVVVDEVIRDLTKPGG
jgi:tetratricopeptide (TPR) repeat protein